MNENRFLVEQGIQLRDILFRHPAPLGLGEIKYCLLLFGGRSGHFSWRLSDASVETGSREYE
jgi:hypothetical protein